MGIRDDAIAAYEAERQTKVDSAAQHLLDTVLNDPVDAKPVVERKDLSVVHEDHESEMFIFAGPNADVHLAVHRGDEVTLVRDDDGWTRVAGPLKTLAELGEVLSEEGA